MIACYYVCSDVVWVLIAFWGISINKVAWYEERRKRGWERGRVLREAEPVRHGRPGNLEGTTRRESRKSDRLPGTVTDVIHGQSNLNGGSGYRQE